MKKYSHRFWVTAFIAGLALTGCEMAGGDDAQAGDIDYEDAHDDDQNAGGDGDSDGDSDSDSDSDSDMDDDYPPEKEESADYMAPKGSGRYVFIADENNDAVVIVDSETMTIDVVEVGSRPTHLVPISNDEDGRVAVMNLDSDEVTLIEVTDQKEVTTTDLPVRTDTNAIVPSPDGRYIIAFHDPRFTAETGTPATDQEISVLKTEEGNRSSMDMAVGMHPWRVLYDSDKETTRRAFIITEEGINIIDLENIENAGIPLIISPFEGGTYDSETADIEITPDGSWVLARKTGSADLVAAELKKDGDIRTFTLEAAPTDLDISPDGSFGVLVLRSLNKVAFFDLPLPEDEEEDPFTFIDLKGKTAGVATLTSDGNHVLLHTTVAGNNEDKKRLITLSKDVDGWQMHSTVLARQIRAVATGVDSKTAVVMHQYKQAEAGEHPYSYSLVSISGLQVKFQQVPVEPGQLLLTPDAPDGNFGFLLLEEAKQTDIINFNTFIVDTLQLGSQPIAAGYAAGTNKVFIAQDHPSGRMTFVGVHDNSVKTVTGYNLNNEIEY